jgi:hypothetical protein
VRNGTKGKANITTYGGAGDDNDIGFVGVDLKNWGGVNFGGKPVFPIAVHMDDGTAYLYKVLEVRPEGLPSFYGYVVDLCNVADADCTNKSKNGLNFLIDIHMSAWPTLGMSVSQGKNYFKTGTYTVIGEIKSSELPKTLWTKQVQSGASYMVCSCPKSICNSKTATWGRLGTCRK